MSSYRSKLSRRDVFGVGVALGGAAVTAPLWAAASAAQSTGGAAGVAGRKVSPFKIGVASYSLRQFPREKMIEMLKGLGVKYVTLKDVHLARTDTPEQTRAARQQITDAGLTIMGGGTLTWKTNDEAAIRKDFEYAKNGGFPLMVCSPAPETLDTLEKLVKEYDIKIAIHNHGPEDPWYPAPADALAKLKGRDPRMGICMDIGHAVRAGADIVQSVSLAGPKLLDLHIKDLADPKSRDSQVEVGRGVLDIPGLFRALAAARFGGHVSLEYEIKANDPFAGMQESLAYMRGVADAVSLT
jgi:sugar phosphate isomerase/epimerase